MTGVGAGVGTGVGNGVGTGVGTGVGSGVGTGVGAGVGTGVGLNVEPGGSGVGAGDGAEGDGPGVGGRDVTPGLLVAAEVNVISGAAVVDPGPLVNATAPVEPDSVVLAASSASNHSQPVDSSLHSSIESNSAQNASPSSSSMATSSSAATPIAQITRRKTKIVSFSCFCLVFCSSFTTQRPLSRTSCHSLLMKARVRPSRIHAQKQVPSAARRRIGSCCCPKHSCQLNLALVQTPCSRHRHDGAFGKHKRRQPR